jgi:D-threo-aldose 1-dehydrogenase
VLPVRELRGTGVITSTVGFGCAGLFRIPRREARVAVLDAAYEAGIRHFDTSPMYGLGLAEAELGGLLKRHREDVTVTTKFGIDPTFVTRTLAPLQGPARAFLAKRPAINDGLMTAGKDPNSGLVGRLLYSSPGYQWRTAHRSLERSLRALATDYIDVFLLHDPLGGLMTDPSELADYLDEQCKAGRIRCWGVTGQPSRLADVMEGLRLPAVIQHREDVFDEDFRESEEGARITYGVLMRALSAFQRFFAHSRGNLSEWSERLGMDLAEDGALPRLLLSAALLRNAAGPVLFTTTRPERTIVAAGAAERPVLSVTEMAAFSELVAKVRVAIPEFAERSSTTAAAEHLARPRMIGRS